jgi:hypothetical protein
LLLNCAYHLLEKEESKFRALLRDGGLLRDGDKVDELNKMHRHYRETPTGLDFFANIFKQVSVDFILSIDRKLVFVFLDDTYVEHNILIYTTMLEEHDPTIMLLIMTIH